MKKITKFIRFIRLDGGLVSGLDVSGYLCLNTLISVVRPALQEAELLLGDRATRKHAKDS